jgi:putative ABC transport system permease protein
MTSLVQDIRLAIRLMLRSSGLSLLIVLTLTLGVGANAAIFSVVHGVLLTPLPYRDSGRLMAIFSQLPSIGFDKFWVSPPEYLQVRDQVTSFGRDVAAYVLRAANIVGRDQPVRARTALTTANLATTLGVSPELGRYFTAAEDKPNGAPVVVLSDAVWRRAFGADPQVLGRLVQIDGRPRTVVGIMPPPFDLADQHVDLWMPLGLDPSEPGQEGRHYLYMIGRLRPGVSLTQARAEVEGLLARWKRDAGPIKHTLDPKQHRLKITSLIDDLVGDVRSRIMMISAAVGLLLLIACLNVANLLLARAESRHKEIAVRVALGAGQRRLLRQFLTESLLLALLGGGLGLLLAVWGVKGIVALNADSIPRAETIGVDGTVVAFTLGVALLTGLLFGLAPSLHARHGALSVALKESGRTTAAAASSSFRRALVVMEIAVASFLVIGAGLLIKSFWLLGQVQPGFAPDHLLTLQVSLPRAAYPEARQAATFFRNLELRLSSLPGVSGAAVVEGLPPKRDVDATETVFESLPPNPDGAPRNVDFWQFVSRDYFRTMGIPLAAGRFFSQSDDADTPAVAVVNRTMAKTFWPHRSPVGDRVRSPEPGRPWVTIVGVVGDVKQQGLEQKTGTELYFLQDQQPKVFGQASRTMFAVVRTASDPMQVAPAARQAIHDLDPSLPASTVRPMDEVLFDSVARPRLIMLLVVLFAGLALLLAAIGTYGVLSYTVAQRTREFGVRYALGARSGQVLKEVMRQAMQLAGAGLALGIVGALALHKLMAGLLFSVAPTDLSIYVGVLVLLGTVAAAAAYLPARRAARVDPSTALRTE